MKYQVPINELKKYSFKFSVLIMLSTSISTYVVEGDFLTVLFRSLLAFLQFFCSFILNIELYKFAAVRNIKWNDKFRFFIGVAITMIFVTCTQAIINAMVLYNILPHQVIDSEMSYIMASKKKYFFIPFVSTVIFAIVDFFHRFIILANVTHQSEVEVVRLQTMNVETTNQLLKQQIQPHFLFNALNTLKSLIRKHPEEAEDYLIQLSDFLRASLSAHKHDTVALKDELELCTNYMEMQKTRFGDALLYTASVSQSDKHNYILPFFSLQPLLENAIKHNEFTKLAPLKIDIFVEDNTIVVKNNLKLRKFVDNSTGNGLSNLQNRYRILFQQEIDVQQTENEFIVRLKLFANENRSN